MFSNGCSVYDFVTSSGKTFLQLRSSFRIIFRKVKLKKLMSMPSSTVLNNSLNKSQQSILDAYDLWAHRQYCIKNSIDSVVGTTTLAQEHTSNNFPCALQNSRLKLYHANSMP